MILPTVPRGSPPRPPAPIEAVQSFKDGQRPAAALDAMGADELSTPRDTAFETIRARAIGTALAAEGLR
ncbi:MAG TPA: hypothetical protein VLI72_11260 [Methylibium sp.]|nr:hypothetical protein [Methylibium sp.]